MSRPDTEGTNKVIPAAKGNEPSPGEFPKGPKPGERDTAFFEDPMIDHLLRAIVTLTMELSVSRERVRSLEDVLVEKGLVEPEAIDDFEPDGAAAAERGQKRAKLIDDVLGSMVNRLSQPD